MKPDLIKNIQILKPNDIKDLALDFIALEKDPLRRAIIIYAFKKFVEIVEKNDKVIQSQALEKYYEVNRNAEINGLEVIRREETIYEIKDTEKAQWLEDQIREFKLQLEELKIPIGKKHQYYLKEKKNGK